MKGPFISVVRGPFVGAKLWDALFLETIELPDDTHLRLD